MKRLLWLLCLLATFGLTAGAGGIALADSGLSACYGGASAMQQAIASLPGHYERDAKWALATPYSTAANRYTILTPARLSVNINDVGYYQPSQTSLDLSAAANWDATSPTDYTQAASRLGKDFYLHACVPASGMAPKWVLSANSTYPTGYSSTTCRKVGGFHCLPDDIGTIASHPFSGFLKGDVVFTSIWDLRHKVHADATQEGMAYVAPIRAWVGMYPYSGTGASSASVYGGTVTVSRIWNDAVDDGAAVGWRLLNDREFQVAFAGSNEQTNIYGSVAPITAGAIGVAAQTTGTGLNDITVDRSAWSKSPSHEEIEITIDATGTPDTFKWRSRDFGGSWSGYTSGVALTGGWQAIDNGAKIKFAATTGHVLNNVFSVYLSNGPRDTAARAMISNYGLWMGAGAYWYWLNDQSYLHSPDGTVSAAGLTYTIYYAASPGGNPVYLRQGADGVYYLASNLATATADKYIGSTNYKIPIKYEAGAATGAIAQVYYYNAGTQPARLIANIATIVKDVFIPTNNPSYVLQIAHNVNAASVGVALNYDDGADNRLEAVVPTLANGSSDLATWPGWNWKTIGGSKGQFYGQGSYGDAKLIAGASWTYSSYSGSRSRYAFYSRWSASSNLGARLAAEPEHR